jgi:methylamine dehydrogenase heavy chain
MEYQMLQRIILTLGLILSCGAVNAQWDSIVGETLTVGETSERWVTVRNGTTAFLVDADAGDVKGTLTLSRFSPALASHATEGKIYSYGSFYTREYYGDRTDVVLIFDIDTASPIGEIEIPAKSAGIGHAGMIGLIKDTFVGVWNITPATSVSITNIRTNKFVTEISTPGCAAIYPVADGFLSPCGDGTIQYIVLSDSGEEVTRTRSRSFFRIMEDPVYDLAVRAGEGWMFMSLDGLMYEVTVDDGEVIVGEPFNINPKNDGIADINNVIPPNDDDWRIGGRQPFAYHAGSRLLMTVMHPGGGQETFEQPGTEIWGFNMITGNRGFRLKMDEGVTVSSVLMTPDADPLLVMMTSEGLMVHDPRSGRKLREIPSVTGNMLQSLY